MNKIDTEFEKKLTYYKDRDGTKIYDTSKNEGNKNYLKQTFLSVGN